MPRFDIRDYRRNELIDAAIASIAARGLTDTTLATIASEAGVSPALVNHYFEGKEALLEATLRRITRDLARTIAELTPPGATPRRRLEAIIDGCLMPEHLSAGPMAAWRAFWTELPSRPRLAALQRLVNRRFRSNMRWALRRLLPEAEVERAYLGLFAMIDGFWVRQFIEPGSFEMATARQVCRDYLDRVVGRAVDEA
ncbi:MAG: transcriptional regulator BetI [Dongiaceae bacterium]